MTTLWSQHAGTITYLPTTPPTFPLFDLFHLANRQSHVFCIDCSTRCQLSGQRDGQRPVCPACNMNLPNPDDVVITNLNPTEDYKTSVLSGLSPNIIIECAGRSLGFWAYQTTQEMSAEECLTQRFLC